jgi:uncharacterized membrane protein (DUF4010 family)
VSSTAVTLTFAGRSKEEPKLASLSAVAIAAASATMFARIVAIVAAVDRPLLANLAAPLLVTAAAGLGGAALLYRRVGGKADAVPHRNPFELRMALKFGLFYAAILFIAKAAQTYIGSVGVFGSAVLAGLVDVDPITVSLSDLHRHGMSPHVAATGIALAAVTNTVLKVGLATFLGSRALGVRVAAILGVAVILGVGVALAVFVA